MIVSGVITLTSEEEVVLHAAPVTAAGNPAGVDGSITWTTTDPALITLTPVGFDCTVTTNGPLGSASVTAEADADLGAGIVLIQEPVTVTVVSASATSILLTADDPTLK
jgi:hypothetical protein